jgi:hypothetical protein
VSGSVAKGYRRDLRRAVGSEALGLIDAHTAALDHQVLPNLNALQARLEDVDERLRALEHQHDVRLTRLHTAIDTTAQRVAAFLARPFWQRLRWLVTGR